MALKALREFSYGGKVIAEGETFEAFSPHDERLLIAVKRAAPVEEKTGKGKSKAEDDETKAPTTKETSPKKYQTRKLTAEDSD
jgi:hypothetical protein